MFGAIVVLSSLTEQNGELRQSPQNTFALIILLFQKETAFGLSFPNNWL